MYTIKLTDENLPTYSQFMSNNYENSLRVFEDCIKIHVTTPLQNEVDAVCKDSKWLFKIDGEPATKKQSMQFLNSKLFAALTQLCLDKCNNNTLTESDNSQSHRQKIAKFITSRKIALSENEINSQSSGYYGDLFWLNAPVEDDPIEDHAEYEPANADYWNDYEFPESPMKYTYSAKVKSTNDDKSFDTTISVESPTKLTPKQIYSRLWNKIYRKYNVNSDMKKADAEYEASLNKYHKDHPNDSIFDAMSNLPPFPEMEKLMYGPAEVGIPIVSVEMLDTLQANDVPAIAFEDDTSSEFIMNDLAKEIIETRELADTYIGKYMPTSGID